MTSYDYIIVGGGTAGLVLAARLTEDSSKQVLVLEAGEDLTGDARLSVPAMWPTLLNTDADWKFKTVPQVCYQVIIRHINTRQTLLRLHGTSCSPRA